MVSSEKGDKIINVDSEGGKVRANDSIDGNPVICCTNKNGPMKNKKKTTFTHKQTMCFVMLASAEFMSFCSMSIMSPFFPAESAKKGVSGSVSGLIFAVYALVIFLSSPVFGKVVPKFGAKFIYIAGLFLSGISSVAFSVVDKIENYTLFVAASSVIRCCEALGASAYCTAGFVLVVNYFPERAGAVRGLLETFVGLGLSAGPGIGGVLYSVGGFGLPFYTLGSIIIIIAFLNIYILERPEKNDLEKSGSLTNLLKLTPVLITCTILIIASMTASYLDPTLEPHLRKFSLTPTQVGLLFLVLSGTYGLFSPVFGWLTDKISDYTWLMTTGLFCNSLVLLFLGPSPLFTFLEDSISLNAVALSTLGVFIAMSVIPTYQFILDSAMHNGFQDNVGTHSIIAGLWSSVYSLGEVIGPILGGTVMEHFGFPMTSTMIAFINFVGAVLFIIYFKLRNRSKAVPTKTRGIENSICHIESNSSIKRINDDSIISIRL